MTAFDEAPILALGTTPIPGAAPCGAEVSEDEQYISVMAEVGKLDRIELGEPDWYQVEQDAMNILRAKSKDFEAAAALGFALFKSKRYHGLAAALGMLTAIVNTFWEGGFPERQRRRKARIETLTDRFTEGGWFRDHAPASNEFDAIDSCVARIGELAAALTAKMPDDPPEFKKFITGLKEMAARRPSAAAPLAGAAGTGASQASAGGPAFAAAEVKDVSGALNAVLAACTFIRNADPTDPIPYAVLRVVKWSGLVMPATDAAKTQIDPPEAQKVEALAHQMANGLWDHLLKTSEGAFRAGDPLWLDLQRYTCAALKGLGPTFDRARESVQSLTGALMRRFGEGLFEFHFKTGMPLCSGETRMWLESEVLAAAEGGGGGKGQPVAGVGDGKLTEAVEKARQLVGGGKLKEAIGEMQAGLASCTQRRDRLLWRLRMGELCFNAQRLELASPMLEECFEEVRRYHIEEWEPSLVVELARTLYRCRKSLAAAQKQPTPEALNSVRESFAWLCQLDPLAALAAEPGGG